MFYVFGFVDLMLLRDKSQGLRSASTEQHALILNIRKIVGKKFPLNSECYEVEIGLSNELVEMFLATPLPPLLHVSPSSSHLESTL